MSKKDQYIEQLRQARINHKKWMNQIRLIVSGLDKKKTTIPLNQSESQFGDWLYSKATVYSISNSKIVLTDIETLFNDCYNLYHKIYAILFNNEEGSILSSLFGSKKASRAEYKLAEQHYEKLVEKSEQLLKKVHIFKQQLTATNFEKFERALETHAFDETNSQEEPKKEKAKAQRYYRGSLIE